MLHHHCGNICPAKGLHHIDGKIENLATAHRFRELRRLRPLAITRMEDLRLPTNPQDQRVTDKKAQNITVMRFW